MARQRPFLFLFSFFLLARAGASTSGATDPVATDQALISISNTLFVSKTRPRSFRTIQEAIDNVPTGNNQWVRIHVEAGVYREKVTIPVGKPFIFLEGEGREQTVIEWGAHAGNDEPVIPATTTAESATFTVYADNFTARWIAFKNNYQVEGIGTRQAVAALIAGDRTSFYGCSFLGFQDTLSDLFGRHYFRDCYIAGAIDFIFGFAQSIYEKCTLFIVKNTVPGFVTAQGRAGPRDLGGFVFNGCNLTGDGKAYLGRAWGPYSRVVFYDTSMADVVEPQGWDSWNYQGHEGAITFVESNCFGPGSVTSQRVRWAYELRSSDVKEYTSITFIDGEGWLGSQPSS